jgi:DNA replication and repair protein RecF
LLGIGENKLYIKNLKLRSFRNYSSLDVEFAKNFNIIYGNNAQGKTNILEAMFLCASGRSHRTSKDADLVEIGKDGYQVRLSLIRKSGEAEIEINYRKDEKKRIKINDIPAKRIGSLIGKLNAVIFSPEDLMLIKEGPSERRRFLDITISQLKPAYFYELQQYAKLLAQRNSLLKELKEKRQLIGTLDIWNENLSKTGARIIRARADFIKRLNNLLKTNHKRIAGSAEDLKINYCPSVKANNYESIEDIQKSFNSSLERAVNIETKRGSTLYGPQRDDYEILLNNINIKQFGSQGQQRTAVLSIKLSEIDIVKEDTGEHPVLLLDDVMSELDRKRQEFLIKNLDEVQTFITCTDKSFFTRYDMNNAKFFKVDKGVVYNTVGN